MIKRISKCRTEVDAASVGGVQGQCVGGALEATLVRAPLPGTLGAGCGGFESVIGPSLTVISPQF